MNIKLIALDVDGTLVDSSHIYISERNKLALRRCAEQGIEIVLASGRPMALIEPVAKELGYVKYAISANGSAVWDRHSHERIVSREISPDIAEKILSVVLKYPIALEVYCEGRAWVDHNWTVERFEKMPQQFLQMRNEYNRHCNDLYKEVSGKTVEKFNVDGMPMCPEETIAIRIIKECIELFAKRRFSSIANMLGCTVEEVQSAADIIYSLNPKPANGFAEMENLQYVHPDVFVVWHDDKPEIMVNESASARMTINPYYLKILETEKISKETISYIKNKVEQVKWAVKCVDQRNSTLQQVASAIVEWQELFFRFGSGRVVPMRLADIAPKVDMHVSTVSRAIKNKYVQCDYGLFPLSYFFSKTIGEGEDTPDDVKENLRKIIEQENKKKPLSDQKIANMLVEKGFQISRRTVAKYRSELGILGTSERKED